MQTTGDTLRRLQEELATADHARHRELTTWISLLTLARALATSVGVA